MTNWHSFRVFLYPRSGSSSHFGEAMGSCSTSLTVDTAGSCHKQHAPMWLVRVKDVLGMRGKLRPHETLKEEGMLILRASLDEKILVIFVSHQWLGQDHPDPQGEQLQVLQTVLKKIHQGEVVVECDVATRLQQQKRIMLNSAHCKQVLDACIWYDYFSVPQKVNFSTAKATSQLAFIQSIPYYVDSCQLFVALTPSVNNERGHTCNYSTWLRRGWCRTEMWCKILSPHASDIPVIVISSSESANFAMPHWLQYPVPTGQFAIESDLLLCCQVVRKSLEHKLSQLRQKDVSQFRFFTARFDRMVGLPPQTRSMERFWSDFAFQPGVLKQKGLSPTACATLAEDGEVLRNLVAAKASLESTGADMTKLGVPPGMRPLHLATTFASKNLRLLETLLDLRANINFSPPTASAPLSYCRTPAAVELLVSRRAAVNLGLFGLYVLLFKKVNEASGSLAAKLVQVLRIPLPSMTNPRHGSDSIFGFKPIHALCILGAPANALAMLLALRADPNGGTGGAATIPPLGLLATEAANGNMFELAQLLLDKKANVNQRCEPEGVCRMLELAARGVQLCSRGEPGLPVRVFSNMSTTALGFCALYDRVELADFLLQARADPEIRNHRGLRPIDLALSERMRQTLMLPRSFSIGCLVTELVSEHMWTPVTAVCKHSSRPGESLGEHLPLCRLQKNIFESFWHILNMLQFWLLEFHIVSPVDSLRVHFHESCTAAEGLDPLSYIDAAIDAMQKMSIPAPWKLAYRDNSRLVPDLALCGLKRKKP